MNNPNGLLVLRALVFAPVLFYSLASHGADSSDSKWRSSVICAHGTAALARVGDISAPVTGADSPHLVGFYRDQEGKIKPIYANTNELQSVRNLERAGIFGFSNGWNPHRIIREIPVTTQAVMEPNLDGRTADFDLLPEAVRNVFQSGQIFVTAPGKKTDFSVLMAVAPNGGKDEGRTGILFSHGKPLIVTKQGKEYLVEIKGIGTPEGGFDYDYNSRRGNIRGGVEAGDAFHEFKVNQEDQQNNPDALHGNTVLVPASFSFHGNSVVGRQAILVRLTPGTLRSSFRGKEGANIPEPRPEELARGFGETWGNFIGRGMIPVSHFENLIGTENYHRYVMTDYADIVPIGKFPIADRQEDTVTLDSLAHLEEMPGYRKDIHFPLFRDGFVAGLEKGKRVDKRTIELIKAAKTTEQIGKILWDGYLALEYFRQKEQQGWIPLWFQYVDKSDPSFQKDYFKNELPRWLRESHQRNLNRILRIESDISRSEEWMRKSSDELKRLKTSKSAQQEWKDKFKSEMSWADNNDAELELERYIEKIEYNLNRFPDWKKRQSEEIAELHHRNKGLEETGFNEEGIIRLVQSPQYIRLGTQYGSKYQDIELGNIAFAQTYVGRHLKNEVAFLEKIRMMTTGFERDEVAANIEVAKARLAEISNLSPYDFYQRNLADPNYWMKMSMLPYHCKKFRNDPAILDEPQYEMHLQTILALKAQGKI